MAMTTPPPRYPVAGPSSRIMFGASSPEHNDHQQQQHPHHHRQDLMSVEYMLSYSELAMGRNGSVLSQAEKAALRERYGYCKECVGQPIQLYSVKKSRMNPLWITKEPRTVDGVCADGVCFVCHPDRDPQRRERRRHRRSSSLQRLQELQLPQLPSQCHPPSQAARDPTSSSSLDEEQGIVTAEVTLASTPNQSPAPSPSRIGRILGSVPRTPIPSVATDATRSERDAPSPSPRRRRSSSPHHRHHHPQRQEQTPPSPSRLVRRLPSFRNIFRLESTSTTSAEVAPFDVPFIPQSQPAGDDDQEQQHRCDGQTGATSEELLDSDGAQDNIGTAIAGAFATSMLTPPMEFTVQQQEADQFIYATPQSTPEKKPSVAIDSIALGDEEIEEIISQMDSLVWDMQSSVEDDTDGEASAQFVAEILLGSMKEHDTVDSIQAYCLRTICSICKGHDRSGESSNSSHSRGDSNSRKKELNQEAIMRAHGGELIVQAMARFPDSAVIQQRGCAAIGSLGINMSSRVELTRAGACLMLYKALSNFMTTESLVSSAIGAMRTLSPQLEAREAFKTLDTSKITVQAMITHSSCFPIQRDACALLSNLAVNIERQMVAVVPREEMEAVVNAMANHRDVVSVIQGACFALKNFSYEEKNCRTLRYCKNAEDLLVHASVFRQSSLTCQADAADILERLQFSKTMDESLEDQAIETFQQAVTDLLQASPNTPEAETRKKKVYAALEFLKTHNDWSPRLVARGLMTLTQLVTGREERDLLFDADPDGGGLWLATIADYCRRWNSNNSVCLEACGLVSAMAKDSYRHAEILNMGWMELIFEALESFKEDGKLVRSALEALKALSQDSEEGMDLVKKELSVLMDAISLHEENEAVHVYGVELVSLAF